MARALYIVLEQLIAVVPAEERVLHQRLKSIRESVSFAPPEVMRGWWIEGAIALHDAIPTVTKPWHQQVLDIWLDKVKPT